MDLNSSIKGCSELARVRGDVTKMAVVSERKAALNLGDGAAEAPEDGTNVCTLLRGNDTEMV